MLSEDSDNLGENDGGAEEPSNDAGLAEMADGSEPKADEPIQDIATDDETEAADYSGLSEDADADTIDAIFNS